MNSQIWLRVCGSSPAVGLVEEQDARPVRVDSGHPFATVNAASAGPQWGRAFASGVLDRSSAEPRHLLALCHVRLIGLYDLWLITNNP